MERVVRWAPVGGEGIEHLVLKATGRSAVAEGVVVGSEDGVGFGLRYRVTCDGDWHVREVRAEVAGKAAGLHLRADGNGSWTDAATGMALPHLAGCVDVDVSATPFTNTLPIRRLRLAPGETRAIRVAYVSVPALAAEPREQRYTNLEDGRLYRFEAPDIGFSADLRVDEARLVLDYPRLFRRL